MYPFNFSLCPDWYIQAISIFILWDLFAFFHIFYLNIEQSVRDCMHTFHITMTGSESKVSYSVGEEMIL
jgi:hypothetical protein